MSISSITYSFKYYIDASEDGKTSNVSSVVGILFMVAMVIGIVGWLFYAYRNPHTPSGQCFIRVSSVNFVESMNFANLFFTHFKYSTVPHSGDGGRGKPTTPQLQFICKWEISSPAWSARVALNIMLTDTHTHPLLHLIGTPYVNIKP